MTVFCSVQNLQQKWESVRILYERRLIDALNNRQYKVEEKKIVKERQIFSESRLLETNDAFRFLQQCLDWVKEKMVRTKRRAWQISVTL